MHESGTRVIFKNCVQTRRPRPQERNEQRAGMVVKVPKLQTLGLKTCSESRTIELGAAVGRILQPGDTVLLLGELGAGKTRLAKGIVSGATGVPQEEVVSPTFTLVHRFEGPFPVHHADLYRLDAGHMEGIGLDDALDEDGALVVEWAEKIQGFHPDPLTIRIRYGDEEDAREIELEWTEPGSWGERLSPEMTAFSGRNCGTGGTA